MSTLYTVANSLHFYIAKSLWKSIARQSRTKIKVSKIYKYFFSPSF